jgi:hypothetical protein
VEEFGKKGHFFEFIGIPPTKGVTPEFQRIAFAKRLKKYFGRIPESNDWWELISFLAEQVSKGAITILFDEISWMARESPELLGIIKTMWDTEFKKNPELIFILCGSESAWIEKNIMSNTGFMGRISLILRLNELPLPICDLFWRRKRSLISAYEKFKILAVTGGIPRYLEEIRTDLPAEENIRLLCFDPSGFLVQEFDKIFSDLFNGRSAFYKLIILELVDGPKDRNYIAEKLNLKIGGNLSDYLNDLVEAGFISRHPTWSIKDAKESNLLQFRLSDNYLRFYLKYILPNRHLIEMHGFEQRSITTLPGFTSIMGLQFENLVFHNRVALLRALGVRPEDILMEGPFFQRPTKVNAGCQIDHMIQTRFATLYICEIKFSKDKITSAVIEEIMLKISKLKRPKYVSCRPVLIHVNGVTHDVEESDFFAKIISFADLFQAES